MSSSILVRRILHPTRKPKLDSILSVAHITTVTSPPSDPTNPIVDPLISDAVSVLTHHRSKSRWSTLRSLNPSGFTPSQFSEITLRLRNNPLLSLRFFLFTRRQSLCSHDIDSCSTLVHILARSRLKSHARDVIRLALRLAVVDEETESERVSKVFRSLVKSYNRCGSAPFVFDLLVKSCLDSKEINGALLIMRKMKSRGISLQISTCNALISEVSKRRDASNGYKLYREVFGLDDIKLDGAKSIKPNANTFNLMMVNFYREGETEMVERIWRVMEEVGCFPNACSYSILMETYCVRGMMSEAEEIWEEMKLKEVEYDVMAYNTMIGGFCNNFEVTKAKELFLEMGLKGIECTSLTYEHLVNGYCKVGDVDSAMDAYREMKKKSFEIKGLSIEALVKGLCEGDRKEGVVEAADIVKDAVRECEFNPSRKCYELLIKRLCEEGMMERALNIQAEMVGRGFKPSRKTYNAFIDGYGRTGDEETSALLATEMTESLKRRPEEEEER